MGKTVLIVEDEQSIVDILSFNLTREGYDTLEALDGPAGLQLALEQNPDLVLLDLMLPGMNGFEVCRRIRQAGSLVPIVMLTAREEEDDKVRGLELGADDYITKPFSLAVLRARVNAQLRRGEPARDPADRVDLPPFSFDFGRMEFRKNGTPVELSKTEQKLLRLLVENRGRTLTRAVLVDRIWSDGAEYVDENALSVTVKRLRDKLEDVPSKPRYLKTVYGLGYAWTAEE